MSLGRQGRTQGNKMEKDNRREHYGEIASAAPRNDTVGGWTGVLTRIGWLGQIGWLTWLGRVFLSPVRIKHKPRYNSTGNKEYREKYSEFVHYSPPLSIKYPNNANIKNEHIPYTKFAKEIFSGEINLPIIKAPKMICAKLNINLAKFSLRLFVRFINNIVTQTKLLVKGWGMIDKALKAGRLLRLRLAMTR
ncbi:MAG: hypothetical protein KJ967_06480, partial [Elusimicrobia bacterium]|nr:hypothetical protein [Elusimicrobiota bacterium]